MTSHPVPPPPVRRGDRVGIAALSGPVEPARLEAGFDGLRALGYEPVGASNLRSRAGLFAGTDDERLEAFHRLAGDASVGAIVFARGGHGVLRLLPRIDWALLARRPRAYVGYSDLTPFLLEVVSRLGLVAFHGPMAAVEVADGLDDEERRSFTRALRGRLGATHRLRFAAPGRTAEGPLLGGCLSLLAATLGTPHAPDLAGAVLFFEDVDEPAYRLDRMLTHLRLSGNLAKLEGLVAGYVTGEADGAGGRQEPGGEESPIGITDLLRDLAQDFDGPVAWGLSAGHSRPNLTLPLGAWARLDAERGLLRLRRPKPGRSASASVSASWSSPFSRPPPPPRRGP